MKTIILNEDSVSTDIFSDDTVLTITDKEISVGYPVEYIIMYANSKNSSIATDITKPENWEVNKYKYINQEWVLNDNYEEPE
tara:strand:- start:54 stop:299 length:246 start_codon:yes stop_codon:yes gene_type:complete